MICFDKTGTLTEEGLDVMAIREISSSIDNQIDDPIDDPISKSTTKSTTKSNTYFITENEDLSTTHPKSDIIKVLVGCHGLALLKEKLVGDGLEIKMFEATKWTLYEPNHSDSQYILEGISTVAINKSNFPHHPRHPHRRIHQKSEENIIKMHIENDIKEEEEVVIELEEKNNLHNNKYDNNNYDNNYNDNNDNNININIEEISMKSNCEIGILKRFDFSSELQRMSTICKDLTNNEFFVCTKGAPEMIAKLANPSSCLFFYFFYYFKYLILFN